MKNSDRSEKLLPHSLEAERSVIGAMLRDNTVIPDVVHFLTGDDFYNFAHQKMFRAMADIYVVGGNPVDPVILAEHLNEEGLIRDIGGHAYLVDLWNAAPSTTNAVYYGQIVRQKAILRALLRACQEIQDDVVANAGPPLELLEQASAKIGAIGQRAFKEPVTIGQAVNKALDRINERSLESYCSGAILTGLTDLDNLTGGFQPGELVIIAARTSIGKTALALDLSLSVVEESQIPTLFFSMEMSAIEIADRACARHTKINSWKFRRPQKLTLDELEALTNAGPFFHQQPLYIDDDMHQSVTRIMAVARREKCRHKIGMVVADYLQLIQPDNQREPRHEQLAVMTRGLKAMARELKIPVLVLCQLNREADKSDKPKLSQLRESGAIEQDADTVLLLSKEQDESMICVNVAKQRNGPTGEVFLVFDKTTGRFSNVTMAL